MFGALRAWFERWRALRELPAGKGSGSQGFSNYFKEQIVAAKHELDWGSRERSLQILRGMHACFPDLCLRSEQAFNVFIDLGCHAEAEVLIQKARKRYPRYRWLYAAAFARVAYRRGDLEEALRRYEIVRRKFPRVADGYAIAAACLSGLGRYDDAETVLERGVRKLPDNLDLCTRYAEAATRRLDWSEGLRRWKILLDRREELVAILGVAECLKHMACFGEAEVVLTDACERFRGNSWPFIKFADLLTVKGDFEAAARAWDAVLGRFPGYEGAYPTSAEVLRKCGRDAEADDVLRVGMTRFPGNLAISLEFARNAHYRCDWAAECERWAMVRERFPTCAEAREREAVTIAAIQQAGSVDC